jgi:UTP--glucose-1-phosphate uridylyltransferase
MGVQEVPESEVGKYGIIKPGASKGRYTAIEGLIEKPEPGMAPSNLACLGRFILTPDIFDAIRRTPKGANGEVGLTDAIKIIALETGAYAYNFEGRRYDIGDKCGYIEATVEYALRDPALCERVKAYIKNIASKSN